MQLPLHRVLREPGAVNRAKRQRCRTAVAGCTERHRAPRKVTRTPSSTDAANRREITALLQTMRALARATRELE
jgi:hypothetical protein